MEADETRPFQAEVGNTFDVLVSHEPKSLEQLAF